MLGARVPKATVDEDGYTSLREHDIWMDSHLACANEQILAEAESAAVQR